MSIRYLNAALEAGPALTVTPNERLVLFVLADVANDAGESYLGLAKIAHRIGSARTETVRQALRKLEANGLLVTTIKGAPDRRIPADRRPNLYRLTLLDDPTQTVGWNPEHDPTQTVGSETGDPETDDPTQTVGTPPKTTPRKPCPRPHGLRVNDPTQTVGETTNEPLENHHQKRSARKTGALIDLTDGGGNPETVEENRELDEALDAVTEQHPTIDRTAIRGVVARAIDAGHRWPSILTAVTEAWPADVRNPTGLVTTRLTALVTTRLTALAATPLEVAS